MRKSFVSYPNFTLSTLDIFSCFCSRLLTFLDPYRTFFHEHHQSAYRLVSISLLARSLSSAIFVKISFFFQKNNFRNIIRVWLTASIQIRIGFLFSVKWVQAYFKDHQQTTEFAASRQRVKGDNWDYYTSCEFPIENASHSIILPTALAALICQAASLVISCLFVVKSKLLPLGAVDDVMHYCIMSSTSTRGISLNVSWVIV